MSDDTTNGAGARAIPGLHHVTAISGPPQSNLDFYTGTLQQRLVKRTVNFDDPGTYHLYYGDQDGTPGSILTFFPFVDAGPGRAGPGMASAFAYRVPKGALDGWMERLAETAVDFEGPFERFGDRVIALGDPDGLRVELIEDDTLPVESGRADDGFHSVTLCQREFEPTARLLTDIFGYAERGEETDPGGARRLRLVAPSGGRGAAVDLMRSDEPSIGRQGAGTIHHVAFRAESDEVQLEWRERLSSAGFGVTPVTDRQYFNAIYFREPGGVLFEIATDGPGFAVDEDPETLGEAVALPPFLEPRRAEILAGLTPID